MSAAEQHMPDTDQLKVFLAPEAVEAGIVFNPPREADAGFDLPCLADTVIPAGGFQLVRTGLHIAIPSGWVGLIRDRSSVALRGGAVTAGVIDASYRGEVKVAMHNLGKEDLVFKKGERMSQMVVIPHLSGLACSVVELFEDLGESERGHGGFGSTGR